MDLRGHLDLLLLSILHQIGPAHGYAVIARLKEQSHGTFDLPEGTVYPALHRLERDGLAASDWDSESSRRRRIYRLTPKGEAALSARRRQWQAFARGMRTVIGPGAAEAQA